jgi:hypothetical protein
VNINRITRHGLAAMAVSVAVLWGCLVGEHLIVRRASEQQARALREIQRLRERFQSQPASSPRYPFQPPVRAALG